MICLAHLVVAAAAAITGVVAGVKRQTTFDVVARRRRTFASVASIADALVGAAATSCGAYVAAVVQLGDIATGYAEPSAELRGAFGLTDRASVVALTCPLVAGSTVGDAHRAAVVHPREHPALRVVAPAECLVGFRRADALIVHITDIVCASATATVDRARHARTVGD